MKKVAKLHITLDKVLNCTCWPEAETRYGNDESHKWHGTCKSNDAHINAGCVQSRR